MTRLLDNVCVQIVRVQALGCKAASMTKYKNPLDSRIIKMLQNHGLIKKEAQVYLKQHIYKLEPNEIAKIKNYSTHFGLNAKQKLVDEILELRREVLISKLNHYEVNHS